MLPTPSIFLTTLYASKRVKAGQTGQMIEVMISCNALSLLSVFRIFHFNLCKKSYRNMLSMNRQLERTNSGLAPSASLPNSPSTLFSSSSLLPLNGIGCLTRLEAIAILLHQHDDIIFDYIRSVRSLHLLPPDQYLAICALRDCSDDEIANALKESRRLCETIDSIQHTKAQNY